MGQTRRSSDTVADHYAAEFTGELRHKPPTALFDVVAELAASGPVADIGCGR